MDKSESTVGSGSGCLLRLFWLFAGPAVTLFCLVFLFEKRLPFPSLIDSLYAMAAGAIILIRYIDIRYFSGETAEGAKPATMLDWRWFSVWVIALSVAAWALVRFYTYNHS